MENTMPVNLDFSQTKNSPKIFLRFGHEPSKVSASPALDRNSLQNIGLKDTKLLACQLRPYTSGKPCN